MTWYIVTSPAGAVYGQHQARTEVQTQHFPNYAPDQVLHALGATPLPLPPKTLSLATLMFANGALAWQDTRTLAQMKHDKWAQIKAARAAAEDGGFAWDGSTFDSDMASNLRISGAVQLAQIVGGAFNIGWTLADNSVRTLSAAQMVAVGVAAGQHVAAQRATARALREQIQAATTPQELEAIAWP